ncbi:MAG: UbiX family flavin prenyltransferase [Candidatus Abyssobacteria bacterium SURF_17]|uniref:Flavin prenyltransferase UbiX n=1 Tax=Candidatus Abyssobacteria bacterium SURF_17 TaxID=2093361 RepID=A0A419ESZ3_9BACT|nr:MAG: UbiX family flavin prenyltransferase [Candidatus Abyssubacteria bacterium SURF_17]
MQNIIVAISGASGAPYAVRLLQILVEKQCKVHLTISRSAALVLNHEMDIKVDLRKFSAKSLIGKATKQISYHYYDDITAPIASGTFPVDAMVIIPCSMSTLAGVASGLGTNLILRAAEVTLKERRPLILVPRETPLGVIEIENMLRAARAGACILPAMPAFYQGPKTLNDMVDFVVGKVLNQLRIPHELFRKWSGVE